MYESILKTIFHESISYHLKALEIDHATMTLLVDIPTPDSYVLAAKHNLLIYTTGLSLSEPPRLYDFPDGRHQPIKSAERLQERDHPKTHVLACGVVAKINEIIVPKFN